MSVVRALWPMSFPNQPCRTCNEPVCIACALPDVDAEGKLLGFRHDGCPRSEGEQPMTTHPPQFQLVLTIDAVRQDGPAQDPIAVAEETSTEIARLFDQYGVGLVVCDDDNERESTYSLAVVSTDVEP